MKKKPVRKRPFGVLVLIMLQIISILIVVLDVATLQLGQSSLYWGSVENPTLLLGLQAIYMVYLLVVVIGLWQMWRWAWFIIMIQLGLTMAFELWLYFHDNPIYLGMLVNVIMVLYLNQREVQQAFERRSQTQEVPA